MKKISNRTPSSLHKVVFWASSLLLVVAFTLFVLEKSQVTNFYTKPAGQDTTQATATRPVGSVDYTPATEAEKPTTDQKTQDTTSSSTTSASAPINITLSAAGQDNFGGPVVIRTILENATGGTCTITLTKGSTTRTYSSKIAWQGTYYSCNYDVPFADISAGSWELKVLATQDSKQGFITKTVMVNGS